MAKLEPAKNVTPADSKRDALEGIKEPDISEVKLTPLQAARERYEEQRRKKRETDDSPLPERIPATSGAVRFTFGGSERERLERIAQFDEVRADAIGSETPTSLQEAKQRYEEQQAEVSEPEIVIPEDFSGIKVTISEGKVTGTHKAYDRKLQLGLDSENGFRNSEMMDEFTDQFINSLRKNKSSELSNVRLPVAPGPSKTSEKPD